MSCEEPSCEDLSCETGAPIGKVAQQKTLLGLEISRRQFAVVLGGSVAAIAVVGGCYGIASRDWSPTNTSLWTVRIVRAGRGARLTADGLPAFHEAPGPSDFSSHAVSAVARRPSESKVAPAALGSSSSQSGGQTGRQPGGQSGGQPGSHSGDHSSEHPDAHADGHSGGGGSTVTPFPQPANLTWGDVVVLELEVLNTATVPMLFSPGQLRLKLADGPTITPQDASRSPEAIAGGAVERLWVSYLAPSDATDFYVEFTDPLLDARLALDVPGLATAKAQL
jgi:hypothetical protein